MAVFVQGRKSELHFPGIDDFLNESENNMIYILHSRENSQINVVVKGNHDEIISDLYQYNCLDVLDATSRFLRYRKNEAIGLETEKREWGVEGNIGETIRSNHHIGVLAHLVDDKILVAYVLPEDTLSNRPNNNPPKLENEPYSFAVRDTSFSKGFETLNRIEFGEDTIKGILHSRNVRTLDTNF